MNINMESITKLCEKGSLRWTNHVLVRLLQRGITTNDVVYALQNGEIIEQYPTDYPYPSCLILGITLNDKHMHIVCGIGNIELWLITAYYPNNDKWLNDFKTRKEHK